MMPEYRAYIVGEDGHFIGYEPLVCANDREATETAGAGGRRGHHHRRLRQEKGNQRQPG